jgi:hypothetical protein
MLSLSLQVRNARLSALASAIDGAATPGTLRVYDGKRPDPGDDLTGQTLLAEVLLPQPCAKSIAGGVLAFADIAPVLCRRSGTARWARIADGNEHWVMDVDVGVQGSGAEVELSTLTLYAGGQLQIAVAQLEE